MQYVATCKHEHFEHSYELYFMNFIHFPICLLFSPYGNCLSSFVYFDIYCVGAEIATLMSISDGSDPYFFRRKMEKTRFVKEEMDREMFDPHKSRHLFFYK